MPLFPISSSRLSSKGGELALFDHTPFSSQNWTFGELGCKRIRFDALTRI